MSQPFPSLTSKATYYSAYRGPVVGTDGKFHHFARQCDPVHLRNGYWKFCTYDDDRRAYECGLNNPEEVLKAQDAGDGVYNEIMLRWVSGELDASHKPSVGTAAVHLQTIYNERKLLGTTLSFRGAVPLYPISTDPRLVQYRLTRYGIQKGVLSDTLLSPMSPSRRTSPDEKVSASSTPVKSPSSSTNPASPSISIPALMLSSPQAQSRPTQPLQPELVPVAPSPDDAPVRPSPLIAVRNLSELDVRSDSVEDLHASLPTQNDALLDLEPKSLEELEAAPIWDSSLVTQRHQLEEQTPTDDNHGTCDMHDSDVIADDWTDSVAILSLASSTPANIFHAQVAALPCMDCGSIEAHTSDCWINEATLNLKPTEDLTTSELHQLVDYVNSFDPGPWTTHLGPQQALVEDAGTQVQGMADIIRNLDSTAEDSELQGLDDQSTILLWAFKSLGKVQVLEGPHSDFAVALEEQNDVDVPDA